MEPHAPIELVAMTDLADYRVCAEDSDPRGWTVIDSDGAAVGKVTDLIIDVQALIARYILCSMEPAGRNVLIPVGFARLDDEHEMVHLDFVTVADLEKLPAFTGLPLSEQYGAEMEKALTGVTPASSQPAKIIRRSS